MALDRREGRRLMAEVSVITPFVNARVFLADAIESVLTQRHRDWELLLVDDGSTDGSLDIAREFVGRGAGRIRVIDAEPGRRGAAAARNRGILAATGAFIAFLDADDVYLPGKLEADVAAFADDPSAACVYRATRWWFDGVPGRDWTERLGVALDRTYEPPTLFVRILMEERGDIPCTCGVMIRREALDAVGGFEERFALYEDQSLWAKLFLAYRVRPVSGCHARYRQHAASTSSHATSRGDYDRFRPHRARVTWLEWLKVYAADRHASAEVAAAIDAALCEGRGRRRVNLRRKLRRVGRYLPRL
jgi:glycosyltransferase involved in cell wall biosynthesis